MDTAFMVLALVMAFTGFFLTMGGFGGIMYILWQRGRESERRRAAAGNEPEGNGQ